MPLRARPTACMSTRRATGTRPMGRSSANRRRPTSHTSRPDGRPARRHEGRARQDLVPGRHRLAFGLIGGGPVDTRWLLDALRTGGPAVGLVFLALVFAFLRGTIHTDREFRAMKDDRDFWR